MKTKLPIVWKGHNYYGIKRFDCRVVELDVTKEGGTYFTVLPISPFKFRMQTPTKAKLKVSKLKDHIQFVIYDDWGSTHTLKIPKTMKKEIKMVKDAAINLGIYEKINK